MKKILAFLAAAAVLCACGCGKQTAANVQTTEAESAAAQTTQGDLQEDFAQPAVNESGSTTAPVVAQPTTQPATVPQQAPILRALEQAQNNPAPATTAQPEETTTQPDAPQGETPSETPGQSETQTTVKPTEPTTVQQTPPLLPSAVLQPINSGTYTITISAFLKDKSSDDKLSKIVSGGQTAYWITVPATNLTFKVFPSGGKYYLATNTQYCELTKAQYNTVCNNLNAPFFNFSALQFKRSETVREGLKKYTVEYYDLGGSELALWYSGDSLIKVQMAGDSLPMTVSGSAAGNYFTLDSGLKEATYQELEPIINLSGVLF